MLGVDILAGRVARARIADDGSLAYVREYQLPWTVGMIAPVEGATVAGCSAPGEDLSTWRPTAPTGPSPSFPPPGPA